MASNSIAILGSRGIPARYGGFETFAEELSTRLTSAGMDVTVYCEEHGETDRPESFRGVRLEYVPVVQAGPLTTIIFDVRCLWRARREFDIVYMLGYGASPFCFIPRIWGTVVWINMDGIEWARSKWSALAKLWFRMTEKTATWTASRLIADADAIKKHLLDRHSTTTPISVVAYGAKLVTDPPDQSLLEEYDVSLGDYYLVVCRLEPENHVREIAHGFAESSSSRQLIVVGDIDIGTAYASELRAIDDERVRFVGTIFDQEKLEALRWHSRAYFHGHSVGGTNPSLLEALGCGNRVVAHDNSFNREVAGDTAEYFYNADEIPKIVAGLDEIDPENASRAAPQQRIREFYSWEKIALAYEKLVSDTL